MQRLALCRPQPRQEPSGEEQLQRVITKQGEQQEPRIDPGKGGSALEDGHRHGRAGRQRPLPAAKEDSHLVFAAGQQPPRYAPKRSVNDQ